MAEQCLVGPPPFVTVDWRYVCGPTNPFPSVLPSRSCRVTHFAPPRNALDANQQHLRRGL